MATRKQRNDEDETKEKAERPEREEPTADRDEVVEVELSDDEDDKDDDDVAVEPPEPRVTRADKKRQRGNAFKEAQDKAAAAEAELTRLRAEREAERAHIMMQQRQYQDQQQGNQELDRVYDDQKRLYAAFEAQRAQGLSDAQAADYERQARELELRKYAVISRQSGGGQQINPQQVAALVEYQQIQGKYADIFGNEAARRWGEGRLHQLAAERGITAQTVTRAQYYELLEEAAEDTRRQPQFGLASRQRRPAPDAATRARFSGVPARSGNGVATQSSVRMGRAEKKLAESLHPNLSPEKAWQKWANGPGRRAAAAAAREKER